MLCYITSLNLQGKTLILNSNTETSGTSLHLLVLLIIQLYSLQSEMAQDPNEQNDEKKHKVTIVNIVKKEHCVYCAAFGVYFYKADGVNNLVPRKPRIIMGSLFETDRSQLAFRDLQYNDAKTNMIEHQTKLRKGAIIYASRAAHISKLFNLYLKLRRELLAKYGFLFDVRVAELQFKPPSVSSFGKAKRKNEILEWLRIRVCVKHVFTLVLIANCCDYFIKLFEGITLGS